MGDAIANYVSGGGGGSTPTGTGFRHVTSGVEDHDAKLVQNVDVKSDAAIVESKLALDYSTASLHSGIGAKADDSAVVHLAGTEIITGDKTIQGPLRIRGAQGLIEVKRDDPNNMIQLIPSATGSGGNEWWITSAQHYGSDAGIIGVAGNLYDWNQTAGRIERGLSPSTGQQYLRGLVGTGTRVMEVGADGWTVAPGASGKYQETAYKDQNNALGYVGRDATGLASIPGSTTQSTFRVGQFGVQAFGANNVWWGDNVDFDGTKFVRRYTGYAAYAYSLAGELLIKVAPSGAAGSEILTGGIVAAEFTNAGKARFPQHASISYLGTTVDGELVAATTPSASSVGLGNVTNDSQVKRSEMGAASGVATLDAGGKLPTTQLPDMAIVQYLGSVASQVAMLALTGQLGDWCIRSDLGTTFVITGADPTLLASWTQLAYPAAPITSVNGQTGPTVTLGYSDVGAASSGHTHNHHDLTNYDASDDHAQYARLGGRNSGQSLIGGLRASENLGLFSTSHATKGEVAIGQYDSKDIIAVSEVTGVITFPQLTASKPLSLNGLYQVVAGDIAAANVSGLGGAAVLNVGTTTGTVAAGDDSRFTNSRTPTAHQLDGALHTASGLTTGHFLKATGATSFGFAAHGLGASDVGAPALSLLTALGDLPYRGASAWARLAGPSSGGSYADGNYLLGETCASGAATAPWWVRVSQTGGADTVTQADANGVLTAQPASANAVLWALQGLNQHNSAATGYGVGIKLKNSTYPGSGNEPHKWAGVAAIAGSAYSNETDLAFYTGNSNGADTSAPTAKAWLRSTTGRFEHKSLATVGLPTLGTATGSLALLDNSMVFGLYAGLVIADGRAWLQVMRNDSATAYDLVLQPAGGNVQIGPSPMDVPTAGRQNLVLSGQTGAGHLQFQTSQADTDTAPIGLIDWSDKNLTSGTDRKVVRIRALQDGGTAGQRGGKLTIGTRASGGTTITDWITVNNAGLTALLSLTASRGLATDASKNLVSLPARVDATMIGDYAIASPSVYYSTISVTPAAGNYLAIWHADLSISSGGTGEIHAYLQYGINSIDEPLSGNDIKAGGSGRINGSVPFTADGSTAVALMVMTTRAGSGSYCYGGAKRSRITLLPQP
jgi:hypothetical protein